MTSSNDISPYSILFRTEASHAIGTGHLMRCMALAEICKKQGKQAVFVMHECPQALATRLSADGMQLVMLDVGDDAAELQALVKQLRPLGIVIDGYQFGEHYRKSLHDCGRPVLAMDDGNIHHPLHADVVVNVSPLATPADYETIAAGARLLLGPAYVALRAEFRHAPPRRANDPHHVLITFGGSDPLGLTLPVAEALLSALPADVLFDVVAGGAATADERLEHLSRVHAHRITLHRNTTHMAELMQRAALAVAAAGSTLWELSYLAVPTIAVVVADNQAVTLESPLCDWFGTIDARTRREHSLAQVTSASRMLWNDAAARAQRRDAMRIIHVGGQAAAICNAIDECSQRAA